MLLHSPSHKYSHHSNRRCTPSQAGRRSLRSHYQHFGENSLNLISMQVILVILVLQHLSKIRCACKIRRTAHQVRIHDHSILRRMRMQILVSVNFINVYYINRLLAQHLHHKLTNLTTLPPIPNLNSIATSPSLKANPTQHHHPHRTPRTDPFNPPVKAAWMAVVAIL